MFNQLGRDTDTLLGGRYRVLERIGAGAMATVYRAQDEYLGRYVAVKIITTPLRSETKGDVDDDEVKILAGLQHHGLVALLDAGVERHGTSEPRVYLVMELIDGPDLKHHFALGVLTQRHTAQIGSDLGDSLAYIHSNGVIHRDVKPANILIFDYHQDAARMRAKLTDFGIALIAQRAEGTGGEFLGTAAYLSPIPEELNDDWKTLLRAMTSPNPQDRPTAREVSLALADISASERGRRKSDPDIIPEDEQARMDTVTEYRILDTPPDGAFDKITALAAKLFHVPIAIVSIVDHDRIWFKSRHGMEETQVERAPGLCASAILQDEVWVVENASVDPRTLSNPLVSGAFGLGFYAGAPLKTRSGHNLGTLCILDVQPRAVSPAEEAILADLAGLVMHEMELRLDSRR